MIRRAVRRLRGPRRAPRSPLPTEEAHGLEENERYWDNYAGLWKENFRGYEVADTDDPSTYTYLGDEWANPSHVAPILDEFIFPYLSEGSVAVEIGSGGGRIASRVAPRVKQLICMDISAKMLERLAHAMSDQRNVTFLHVTDAVIPASIYDAEPDFVYSFDVFVHLDLHTQWKYIRQIGDCLRPGGRAFLHTSNLRAKAGWERFAAQERATLHGHFFVMPEMVRLLAEHAGLIVEKEAAEDPSNFYKARDYLVVLKKK